MSSLREQLQNLKEQYESVSYPGDLLGEIKPRQRMRIAGWKVLAVIGSACAASIIVAAIMGPVMWKLREEAERNRLVATKIASPTEATDPAGALTSETLAVVPSLSIDTSLDAQSDSPAGGQGDSISPSFSAVSVPSFSGVPSFDTSESDQNYNNTNSTKEPT